MNHSYYVNINPVRIAGAHRCSMIDGSVKCIVTLNSQIFVVPFATTVNIVKPIK